MSYPKHACEHYQRFLTAQKNSTQLIRRIVHSYLRLLPFGSPLMIAFAGASFAFFTIV